MNKITFSLLFTVLLSLPVQAEWTLNNDGSSLSFVSTKAINAAEVHKFSTLEGGVDAAGNVRVSIALASLDTGIELRDERMHEMLFETTKFESATMTASVDIEVINGLAAGDSKDVTVDGELALHGEAAEMSFDVVVVRTGESQLLVISEKPVVINAQRFRLTQGLEKLREIAGLPSISTAVPVSFILSFDLQ
jgi:polyisoprenoid-binding protein YceI